MTPRVLALVGMPGTGKTTLAQAIATHRHARGRPTFVLHTDLLKHTLRLVGFRELEGPIWKGDPDAKFRIVHPYLHQQTDKARRDGYDLIIEGSLAIGCTAVDRYIQLEAPRPVRTARISQKHDAAKRALADFDPDFMENLLEDHAVDIREVLGTQHELEHLVLGVDSSWDPPLEGV